MRRFRHPSRRELGEWLDRADSPGHPAGAIDRHLESCQRCASILEELDGPDHSSLGDALALVYSTPDDFSDRLERRVVARLDSRVILDVVTDLFGAGIETSKLLLTEEPHHE